MEKEITSGILLIDKPLGITSFDVIRRLRSRFKELGYSKVKMGHAGTLDPAASGLLLVAIGSATKKLEGFIGKDKAYEAVVRLGQTTDTLDVEGEVTASKDASHVAEKQIKDSLDLLSGCGEYSAPLYSAIKVEGRPLYSYARSGQEPPRIPMKTMCVRSMELLEIARTGEIVDVRVMLEVSKGTYIRTLADQLGKNIELPSMLVSLRRTSIAEYKVSSAVDAAKMVESDIVPL